MTIERMTAGRLLWGIGGFLVALLVAGCSYLPSSITPHGVDANDVCATQKQALLDARKSYTDSIVEAISSNLGERATSIVDDIWSGFERGRMPNLGQMFRNPASWLIGDVLKGVREGYFNAKLQQNPDSKSNRGYSRALTASIYQDIRNDTSQIDKATAAFGRLKQCRFAAARRIKADLAAGRIDGIEAVAQLDNLQERFEDDIDIARELGVEMENRSGQFEFAKDELLKADPAAKKRYRATRKKRRKHRSRRRRSSSRPASTASKPDAAGVATVTDTNVHKAKEFNEEVKQAKVAAKKEFSIEGVVSAIQRGGVHREV